MSPSPENRPEETDLELISRWRAGDSRAATRLVGRHSQALARFAASAFRDRARCESVLMTRGDQGMWRDRSWLRPRGVREGCQEHHGGQVQPHPRNPK